MYKKIAVTFDKTNKKSKVFCVSLFFLILVGLGLSLYKDFNISSDEVVERSNGIVSLLYIGDYLNLKWVKNNQQLNSEKNGPCIQKIKNGQFNRGQIRNEHIKMTLVMRNNIIECTKFIFDLSETFISIMLISSLQSNKDCAAFKSIKTYLFCANI